MVTFRSLPFVVRFAKFLTYFLAWVLFAELVIDRHGLDAYLPYYRVGKLCPYDIAVVLLLAAGWWRAQRRG